MKIPIISILMIMVVLALPKQSLASSLQTYIVNGVILKFDESINEVELIVLRELDIGGNLVSYEIPMAKGIFKNAVQFIERVRKAEDQVRVYNLVESSHPLDLIPVVIGNSVWFLGPKRQVLHFSVGPFSELSAVKMEYLRTDTAALYIFHDNDQRPIFTLNLQQDEAGAFAFSGAMHENETSLRLLINNLIALDPEILKLFTRDLPENLKYLDSRNQTTELERRTLHWKTYDRTVGLDFFPSNVFTSQTVDSARGGINETAGVPELESFLIWEIPALTDHYVMTLSNGIVAIVTEPSEAENVLAGLQNAHGDLYYFPGMSHSLSDSARVDGYRIVHVLWPENYQGPISEATWNELTSHSGRAGRFKQPPIVVNGLNVSWQMPLENLSFNALTGRPSGRVRTSLQCSQILMKTLTE